jgi:hypothetical protein
MRALFLLNSDIEFTKQRTRAISIVGLILGTKLNVMGTPLTTNV